MEGKLGLRRAGCALAAAAVALSAGSQRASAHLDGAGLYALPPDPVVIRQEPCPEQAQRASSRGVSGQLRALEATAERLRETRVMPRFWGFHGVGLVIRGRL